MSIVWLDSLTRHSHPTVGTTGLTEPQARAKYGDDAVKICGEFFHISWDTITNEIVFR